MEPSLSLAVTASVMNTVTSISLQSLQWFLRADVPQDSPLLNLPGEIRNCIYHEIVNSADEDNHFVRNAHALASTSRQLRGEFWPFFLSRVTLKVDLVQYVSIFAAVWPVTDPSVMRGYVGNLSIGMSIRVMSFVQHPRPRTLADRWSVPIELIPLVTVLRAAPDMTFKFDPDNVWLCDHAPLEAFLNFVRSDRMWAVTPQLGSLALRSNQFQLARDFNPGMVRSDVCWLVDVRLKRDFYTLYKMYGLLEYLEERSDMGRDGITFVVQWDREPDEPYVVGWRQWVRTAQNLLKKAQMKIRILLEPLINPWGIRNWFGPAPSASS